MTLICEVADPLPSRLSSLPPSLKQLPNVPRFRARTDDFLAVIYYCQAPGLLRIGIAPPTRAPAVSGRGEYLNVNTESYPTRSINDKVLFQFLLRLARKADDQSLVREMSRFAA